MRIHDRRRIKFHSLCLILCFNIFFATRSVAIFDNDGRDKLKYMGKNCTQEAQLRIVGESYGDA